MKYIDVMSMAGQTPHLWVRSAETPAARIHVKLEGYNPTGSVKDRACLNIIRTLEREGKLRQPVTLLDASSGNMACAIALFAKLYGFPATVIVNSKITADKRSFLQYFGAEVIQIGDFTIEGNRYCREVLLQREPGKYLFLDQLHNWSNPQAYYESIGPEILADFPDVAMVVGSLGSGGTMNGTGRFLKEKKRGVKIVTVEAARGARLPGTGSFDEGDYVTPFIRSARDEGIFDYVVKVTEQDAVRRTAQLREQGIFCGLPSGGVLHAAITAINKFKIKSIEMIDRFVMSQIVNYVRAHPEQLGSVMIVPDHYTNLPEHVSGQRRADIHSIQPVPFALWNRRERDSVQSYCEDTVCSGKYASPPISHLDLTTVLGVSQPRTLTVSKFS